MYAIPEDALDEDFPKQFETVIARLNEKTGWNLNAKSTGSIDQVLIKIDALGKDDHPDDHAKAKRVWKTTIMCVDRLGVFVQRFGALAAQVASVAFGPANQCFNAISFVITAVQKYQEVFAKITILMERISVFLENLDASLDKGDVKLDKRLRKTCYRVLEHFVKIMSTAYDLTNSKMARFKLKTTSFAFGEDAGISDYLTTLETLVSDFTGAQISVLVANLSVAAQEIRVVDKKIDSIGNAVEKQTSFLDQLATADASRSQQEREKRDLEVVKKAMAIDDTKTSWNKQSELWDSHITGTGQWLLNKPYFSTWADKGAIASDVILMKGPSGYGKTLLSSVVVRHLQDKYRGDTRVAIAYYYIQRDSGEKSSTLNKVLKTVIWQIAQASKDYCKFATKACEGIDTSRTPQTWKKLITDASKIIEGKLTLFVILDGLDELEKDSDLSDLIDVIGQLQSTSNDQNSHLKVRAFITGEALDPINQSVHATLFIDLEPSPQSEEPALNQADLELYVGDRLERVDGLKGIDDDLKERIRKELAIGARGAYSRLLYTLNDLVNVQNTNQIEDILKRANQSLAEIIANKVKNLESSLSSDEISEVNTLLDWTSSSFGAMWIAQYEGVLSLRTDGLSVGLEDRIRNKYFELFSVSDDKFVTLRAGVEDYLISISTNSLNETTVRTSYAIQAAEVSIVRKVLYTHFRNVFGDNDVYDRFGFETFFQEKLGDQALRIRLVPSESNVRLAQGCLIAVCDKHADERSADLLSYAADYFVDHLGTINVAEMEPAVRQDMGRKLTRLLQEEELIKAWWTSDKMYLTRYFVFDDFNNCRELLTLIHNFLKDANVQKGLTDMPTERQWVARMTSGDTPDFNLFENIAGVMARRWWTGAKYTDDETDQAFTWLRGWIQCLNGVFTSRDDTPTVETIKETVQWVRDTLGTGEPGKWHGALAAAYLEHEYADEAAAEYRNAIELRPTEWQLRLGLAESFGLQKNYVEGIEVLQEIVDQHKELLGSDADYTQMYWERLLHNIATWKSEMKDFAAAGTLYRQCVDHWMEEEVLPMNAHEAVFGLLAALNKQERYSDAVAVLNQCASRGEDDENWIRLIFGTHSTIDDFHHHLVAAAKRSGMLDAVFQSYELALIPDASDDLGLARNACNRFWLANLLWTLGSEQQQLHALDLWEEVVYHEPIPEYQVSLDFIQQRASRHLASALLTSIKRHRRYATSADSTTSYSTRLEKLTQATWDDSGRLLQPRLLHARLLNIDGQATQARDMVRNLLKFAFDRIEANPEGGGYALVAQILQIIDDDINALAAWSYYVPLGPVDRSDPSDKAADVRAEVDNDMSLIGVLSENPTVAGAVDERTDGQQPDAGVTSGVSTKSDSISNRGDLSNEPQVELLGLLTNRCDGCRIEFRFANDFFACKDCLDVQFCPTCYSKVKIGDLDKAICAHDHEHMHIPALDKDAWRTISNEYVLIAGAPVLRSEWADHLRKEWQIDDVTLQTSDTAARKIQKAFRAYRSQKRTGWDGVIAAARAMKVSQG